MKVVLTCCALFVLAGCGGGDATPLKTAEYYTIKDASGAEKQILSSVLNDPETGKPVAKEILVIDKKTNQQKFVAIEEIEVGAPADAKYVIVTSEGVDPIHTEN